MVTTRTTFTLDRELAARAHWLGVDVATAARDGVVAAVRRAMGDADRAAYLRVPETSDDFWDTAEAWVC